MNLDRISFRWKLTLNLVLFTVITTLVIGIVTYYTTCQALMEHLRSGLASRAALAALMIDPHDLMFLQTPADEKRPVYSRLQKLLLRIKSSQPDIKYIYIMRCSRKPNIYTFVIDPALPVDENVNGRIDESEMPAHIGDEYDVSPCPEMQRAFSGPAADREINRDKWGYWLSGYAPIRDRQGNAVAIVGMDMSAARVIAYQKLSMRRVVMALIGLLCLALLLSFFLADCLTRPLKAMVSAIKQIGKGDFSVRIATESQDEIGLLARTFNQMSKEVGDLHAELETRNRDLEQKVAERTVELKEAHEQLYLKHQEITLINAALQERNQHLQMRHRQLQAIVDFQQVILRQIDLDELFRNGFEMINHIYPFEAGGIFYFNSETMHLERKAFFNLTEEVLNAVEREKLPALREANGHSSAWEAQCIKRVCSPLERSVIADGDGWEMDSVVSIPFIMGEKLLGWLVVVALEGSSLQADDRDLLMVLGNEFAIAVDNLQREAQLVQMHEELQKRHEQLQEMHQRLEEANTELEAFTHELSQQASVLDKLNQELSENNRRLEEANRKVSEMAVTDFVTGLANHRAFQERLAEEIRRFDRYRNPLSLMLIDLDDFKHINDRFGHSKGDRMLQEVASFLHQLIRRTDFMARYGGDEFAMILPETSLDDAMRVGRRICRDLAAHTFADIHLTASIGVAGYSEEKTQQTLIEEADQAMYAAKRSGKNSVRSLEPHSQAA